MSSWILQLVDASRADNWYASTSAAGGFRAFQQLGSLPWLFLVSRIRVVYGLGPHDEVTNSLQLMTILNHPQSRGTVRLQSRDPHAAPVVDPNYLAEKERMWRASDGASDGVVGLEGGLRGSIEDSVFQVEK
eukprot:Skav207572  [mRNA]  locus=scaffold1153:88427:89700:+ [translate_table: standard]